MSDDPSKAVQLGQLAAAAVVVMIAIKVGIYLIWGVPIFQPITGPQPNAWGLPAQQGAPPGYSRFLGGGHGIPAPPEWTPTVDCGAMHGRRMVNPNTGAPTCFVPNR